MPAGLDPVPVTVSGSADWNEDLPPLFVEDGQGGYGPDDLSGCGVRIAIRGRAAPNTELEMTTANGLAVIGSIATERGVAPVIGIRVPLAQVPPAGVYDRQVFILRPNEVQPLYRGTVVILEGL